MMVTKDYFLREAMTFGVRNGHKLLAIYSILFVLAIISVRMVYSMEPVVILPGLIQLIIAVLGLSVYFINVKFLEGKRVTFPDIFAFLSKRGLRLFGFSIINAVAVLGGLCLLILPGIYCMCAFMMAPYIIATEDVPVAEAIKRSIALSKGVRVQLAYLLLPLIAAYGFAFLLVRMSPLLSRGTGALHVGAYVVMGLGVLVFAWAIAAANLSIAWAYRKLDGKRIALPEQGETLGNKAA